MTGVRLAELTRSLAALRTRVADAAAAAGRDVDEIQLLPITKFFPASDVILLHRLGCTEFGESREQEASAKAAEVGRLLHSDSIRWHMVGQIQRNKARAIANWADTVHSVAGARVIAALDRAAGQAIADGRRAGPLRAYIQISFDGDAARGGVDVRKPDLVDELCGSVDAAEALEFVGLMGMPPLDSDADDVFGRLQAERDRVQRHYRQPLGLSAGMSGDLEAAVRHGSTCVRVGTAVMGQRPLTSP
jgi:pyridoxal phosphate enzyme (YggS family)